MGDWRVPAKASAERRAVAELDARPALLRKRASAERRQGAWGIRQEAVNLPQGDIGARRRRAACGFAYSCSRPAQPAKQGR